MLFFFGVRYTGHAKGGPPGKKKGGGRKKFSFLTHSGIKIKMVHIPSGFLDFCLCFSWDFYTLSV
jgi:hypothetical protein